MILPVRGRFNSNVVHISQRLTIKMSMLCRPATLYSTERVAGNKSRLSSFHPTRALEGSLDSRAQSEQPLEDRGITTKQHGQACCNARVALL